MMSQLKRRWNPVAVHRGCRLTGACLLLALVATATPARAQLHFDTAASPLEPGLDMRAVEVPELVEASKIEVLRAEQITPKGANQLFLEGTVSYSISGSSGVLTAGRVSNKHSTRTSGTLRLALWMSAGGYRQTGYRTIAWQLGQLGPNTFYENLNSGPRPFTSPPTGCYYVSMLLEEYDGGTWYVVDYRDFANRASINNGCATPTTCSYSISPTSRSHTAPGGTNTVAVTGSPSGCTGSWSSSSNNGWLTVTSGGAGSGAGTFTLHYSVAPNVSTVSRNGSLNIAGKTFSVSQAGTTSPTTCSPGATTACMLNDRFRVTVRYRAAFDDGAPNTDALVKPVIGFSDPLYETSFFYFNSSNNIEMMVKMLDQGNTNATGQLTIAVLFGSATPLRVLVTIVDTKNGSTKTYESGFNQMRGATDFTAFVK
jgi:hypothetical protein